MNVNETNRQELPIPAPCPYCGWYAELQEGHQDHWRVKCIGCGAHRGLWFVGDRVGAINHWNERYPAKRKAWRLVRLLAWARTFWRPPPASWLGRVRLAGVRTYRPWHWLPQTYDGVNGVKTRLLVWGWWSLEYWPMSTVPKKILVTTKTAKEK